ncbi:MAG: hypothetical protein E7624_08805, partial [Ruminococcaceae bacterium]|nr:hypothetical protein [Oscillospiraceae bacterium]
VPHVLSVLAAVAPTCTTTGLTEGTRCVVCNTTVQPQTIVQTVAHTPVIDAAVAPTCTATGLTEGKHCAVCNTTLVAQTTLDPIPHTPIIDAAVAPTCTATGLTEGKRCAVCNTTLVAQTTLDPIPHTPIIDAAVAPTCTATGLTEGKHCAVCNTTLAVQTVVEALGHVEATDAAVPATCIATGLTEGKHCTRCMATLIAQNVVDALGHTEATDAAVPATCIATGLTEGKHCTRCMATLIAQNVIDALGHAEVIDKAVSPTCTATGLTEGKHCARCEVTLLAQNIVSALGHTIVNRTCILCTHYKLDFTDVTIYASDYGYNYLGTLPNGTALQTYYQRLDNEARSFHTDATRNATTPSQFHENQMTLNAISYKGLGLTYEEAALVLRTLRSDRPLYYWLTSSWTYNASSCWIRMQVEKEYANGEARAHFNAMIYKAAAQYYAVVEDEESAYYIALAYHDMIIDAVDYVYETDGTTPQDARWAHSILGVFVGNGVVCEGYAKAFQLLLNVSGVDNVYVLGNAGGRHAWNLVCLDDGNWYWFDLTWDDAKSWFRGMKYNYFAITDTSIVDWRDAHLGYSTPNAGSVTFLGNHTPDGPTYAYFVYALPQRSATPFTDNDIIELRETFTVNGNTYALIGYNKVQLVETNASGTVVIEDTVSFGGRTFEIVSIGAIDANGYFIQDVVFTSNSITSIQISGNVRNVDLYAFGKCFSLRAVKIADGVESIDHFAFYNCYDLKKVTLPKSLTVIGSKAFAYCYDLEMIIFEGTVQEWNAIKKNANWHDGCETLTVYCTDGIIVI